MPLDTATLDLDPYSAQVVHAFDRAGPAVVHVTALSKDGRPAGQGSGVGRHMILEAPPLESGT